MKKIKENDSGQGLALGICFGVVLGIINDNLGVWLPIGAALGLTFGKTFGRVEKKSKDLSIRRATAEDLEEIGAIYDRIHDREEAGESSIGWIRSIYPTRQTAKEALEKEILFVGTAEGQIVAAAKIDQNQVPEYAEASWTYPAPEDEVMVLHTLVVDPQARRRGYGRAFVAFYEQYARENNCSFLRMDTNQKNQTARSMYAELGYREVGVVDCTFNGIPNVKLVCLEKKI